MRRWSLRPGLLRLLCMLALAVVPAGCAHQPAAPAHADPITFSRETEVPALCARVESALATHQFASLDATELEMQDPNVRLVGGNSQLDHYYGALASYSDGNLYGCRSTFSLDQKRQLLEQWLGADPGSIAAHIALAQFWSHVGWTDRGERSADKVTNQQWGMLSVDLEKAKTALVGVDGRVDPHIFFVQMDIARELPDPRGVLDQLYSSAVKAYPNYFHYYAQRANILQKKWFGRPDELKGYPSSLLQAPGGDSGLVAYSYVAFAVMHENNWGTLLQSGVLSWPILKSAYATRERLYGLRNRDWNVLCGFAMAARDLDTAKAALAKIGDNWDPAVWIERQYFDLAVTSILGTQH